MRIFDKIQMPDFPEKFRKFDISNDKIHHSFFHLEKLLKNIITDFYEHYTGHKEYKSLYLGLIATKVVWLVEVGRHTNTS